MLYFALSIFFVLAIIAGAFGFSGAAGSATWLVQTTFFLSVIGFITGLFWGRSRWDKW